MDHGDKSPKIKLTMSHLQQYCKILGVKPGASADIVKQAFRQRIKECHPDRSGTENTDDARVIIEAYNFLKEGVPHEYHNGRVYTYQSTAQHQARRNPGEKIFNSVFGKDGKKMHEKIRRTVLNQQDESLFRDWDAILRATKGAQNPTARKAPSLDKATPADRERFYQAEDALRNVVKRYTRQKTHRAKRPWAIDYIRDLNQVMNLFRTVASRNPSASAAARYRLTEISDLLNSVKMMIPGR